MNDLYKEFEELENKLCPPTPEISEIDELKAKFRIFFEDYQSSVISLLSMNQYYESTDDEKRRAETLCDGVYFERKKKNTQRAIQHIKDTANYRKECDEVWENKDTLKWFDTYKSCLSDMHDGDCVRIPCSCGRCIAENKFNIPYDEENAFSQEEGEVMWERYFELAGIIEKETKN